MHVCIHRSAAAGLPIAEVLSCWALEEAYARLLSFKAPWAGTAGFMAGVLGERAATFACVVLPLNRAMLA